MIRVTNIRNVKPGEYDAVYAIVRSLKYKSAFMTQVPELSPSPELLHAYLNLKNSCRWNRESFDKIYTPQFLREMRYSQEAANRLNQMKRDSDAGKNMALVCFCPDEAMCHRSIIAGMLQGVGAQVVTDTGADYSAYLPRYFEA